MLVRKFKNSVSLYSVLICLAIFSVFIYSECLAKEGEDLSLTGSGYITVSGGCFAWSSSKILLEPQTDGYQYKVIINTKKGHGFLSDKASYVTHESILPKKDVENFFAKMKSLTSNLPPRKIEAQSTYNLTIEIFLPFKAGTLSIKWNENESDFDIYVLRPEINKFVERCLK